MNSAELARFQEHAVQAYPHEACGALVNGKYHPCENLGKQGDFEISAVDLLKLGEIEAILHSHCYDPLNPPRYPAEWPSHADMDAWIGGDIPWGIIATDGTGCSPVLWLDDDNRAPLVGRDFIHGVHDCYSVIRDYFKQERKIDLKNIPREFGWWQTGSDHYALNYGAVGFKAIKRSQLELGDCILYQVNSPVINHAAVVTGTDTILHHLMHGKSCFQSRTSWFPFERLYVRYEG